MSARPERGPTVFFVCTGNTCRSPFAAAFAERHGLDASSAGLDVREPRARAEAVAATRAHGVDLSAHVAREVTDEAVAAADVVVGQTDAHARLLRGARVPAGGIEDPYALGADAYARADEGTERAVAALAEELR